MSKLHEKLTKALDDRELLQRSALVGRPLTLIKGPHILGPAFPRARKVIAKINSGEHYSLRRGETAVVGSRDGFGAMILALGKVKIVGPALIIEGFPEEVAELRGFGTADLVVAVLGACLIPAAWGAGYLEFPEALLGLFATGVLLGSIFKPRRIAKRSLLMSWEDSR